MNNQTRNDHRRMIRTFWISLGIAGALLVGLKAHGEDTTAIAPVLPDAPTPQRATTTKETPREHAIRMSVLSSLAVAEWGDWETTMRCGEIVGCREVIIPQALASSPAGMAAFVATKFVGEWYLSNKLARKHPKLAIAGDLLSSVSVWATVGHNLAVDAGRPPKTAERKLGK